MRIACPFCGERTHAEFAYLGDAGAVRPATHDARPDPTLFHDYVYLRDNVPGAHREYWQHVGGCRSWLVVTRNVSTHAILAVATAHDSAPAVGRVTR